MARFNAVYALKEQLQQLWHAPASFTVMGQRLDAWCALAEATGLAPMKRFVAMLQRHRTGICTTRPTHHHRPTRRRATSRSG
ncbi:Mobile element protein [Salinisphaera sp. LB1]|nr:Mobile element protein [Salinisphaera sp. LB1]